MDQVRIGEFIAKTRKEKGYTQKELAERIGLSDKAVSKWERGNSLPDISVMMDLCEALELDINELLSGEKLESESYHVKAEENMKSLIEENEKVKREHKSEGKNTIFGIIAVGVLFVMTVILTSSEFDYYVDVPSIALILVVDVLFLIADNGFADFGRGFALAFTKGKSATEEEIKRSILIIKMIGKVTMLASAAICLVSITALLHILESPETIGPNIAVCILTITYSLFIALILVPIRVRLEQRLIEKNYIKV